VTLWGLFFFNMLARAAVGLFTVFVYSLFLEEPLRMSEVLPEQKPIKIEEMDHNIVELSDIEQDDMLPAVTITPVPEQAVYIWDAE
jgi:hypothetical protein